MLRPFDLRAQGARTAGLIRFLFPGLAMSLGAQLVSPSAVVSAHCAAHLLIPVAFSAPPGASG
jgi:hypothetical protein